MGSEPSLDAYAWETMSENLVRSGLSFGQCYTSTSARTWRRLRCCPPRFRQQSFFVPQKLFLAWSRKSPIVSSKWLPRKQPVCSSLIVLECLLLKCSSPETVSSSVSHLRRSVSFIEEINTPHSPLQYFLHSKASGINFGFFFDIL